MANQNFRVKNGLTVGTVEIANSSGVVNASALSDSGVSAGSAGNTTTIPVVTVNTKGLITGLTTASVSGVSSFNYTTSNATFSLGTGDGTTYAQTVPYANTTIPGVIKVGDLLEVNATGFVSVAESSIDIHNLSGYVANENIDHTAVTLTAGSGLTGGGTIAASRTFTIGQGTGITVTADAIETNDSEIDHDSLSGFVANEHIDHSTVTLTAGNGLTGGGTIAASRSFAVTGGTGVTSNATGVHIGQDVGTASSVTFDDVDVDGDLRDGSNRVFKVYDSSGTLVWG